MMLIHQCMYFAYWMQRALWLTSVYIETKTFNHWQHVRNSKPPSNRAFETNGFKFMTQHPKQTATQCANEFEIIYILTATDDHLKMTCVILCKSISASIYYNLDSVSKNLNSIQSCGLIATSSNLTFQSRNCQCIILLNKLPAELQHELAW